MTRKKPLSDFLDLVEVEPGKWRIQRAVHEPKRSDLPVPYVISDHMEPTEQVDGQFYTSKRAFRAVGKANGLIEVGNERIKPFKKTMPTKGERMQSIKAAIDQYKSGGRPNAK